MPDPNSYQAIGWLVVGIAALLVIINQGVGLVKSFRGQPENSELKGGADVLSQRVGAVEAEQREAVSRRRAMHDKIDKVETALQAEMKRDVTQMYGELNKLRDDVAGLKKDNEHQNRHLTHIEAKLDRLIERNR